MTIRDRLTALQMCPGDIELLRRPVRLLYPVQYVTHSFGALGLDPAAGGADVQRRHGFDA
jgi:hypothetical protein